MMTKGGVCGGSDEVKESRKRSGDDEEEQNNQLSVVAFLVAALRKSMVSCTVVEDQLNSTSSSSSSSMEIGWPTNVQHLSHVTFDRFHGFLGLPLEFQVEIPCRVPSARFDQFPIFLFFNFRIWVVLYFNFFF